MDGPIVCNVCGKTFDFYDSNESFGMHHYIGYGSKHDGEILDLNLCCKCFDKVLDLIIPMCKHTPVKGEYL